MRLRERRYPLGPPQRELPGGKERMRRPMRVIASGRIDLRPMVADRFTLGRIEATYKVFSHQRDGVLKVAITP